MISLFTHSPHYNLTLLWWLRTVYILCQSLTIFITERFFPIGMPSGALWGITGVLVLANGLTWLRLRVTKSVGYFELFAQMLFDLSCMSLALYYTGGVSNPFTSLFILHVVIAAIMLSPLYGWLLATAAIALYTALLFYHVDLPHLDHHVMTDFFSLHVQGMWVNFIVLALLIPAFVMHMSTTIRRQDKMLFEAQQLAVIATFAANAAHELGTPLATIALLAGEYQEEAQNGEQRDRYRTLSDQIQRCKTIVSGITFNAGIMRAESGKIVIVKDFIADIAVNWQQRHVDCRLETAISPSCLNRTVRIEYGLEQALYNVLDNARQSGADCIRFSAHCSKHHLDILILDNGRGIDRLITDSVGQIGISTRENGLGMGLYLAKSIITRSGGTLSLRNNDRKGAIVTLKLPLPYMSL